MLLTWQDIFVTILVLVLALLALFAGKHVLALLLLESLKLLPKAGFATR